MLALSQLVPYACSGQCQVVVVRARICDQKGLAAGRQIIRTIARELEAHNHLLKGGGDYGHI